VQSRDPDRQLDHPICPSLYQAHHSCVEAGSMVVAVGTVVGGDIWRGNTLRLRATLVAS
jgi:hypothetical protein